MLHRSVRDALLTLALPAVALLLAGGCEGKKDALPVALCEAAPYELLPTEEVGQLVDYEEVTMLDLDASSVDALIGSTPLSGLGPSKYGIRVFQMRYRTQDRGRSVEATAAVAFPANADLPSELPLMIFTHGTTGFSDPCAPSADIGGQMLLGAGAAQGYIVVGPDFLGITALGETVDLKHPYLIGEPTAIASWDAARAAIELSATVRTEAVPSRQVAIMGPSQGGHAAFFVARYGPHYAPEFEIDAVLPSIPPIDVRDLLVTAANDPAGPSVLLAAMLNAHRHWYGAPATLEGVISNEAPAFLADNIDDLMYPTANCDAGDQIDALVQNGEVYDPTFVDGLGSGDVGDPWECYFRVNSINTTPVPRLSDPPFFIAAGELDPTVPLASVRSGMAELCQSGYGIELLVCEGAGHAEGTLWALEEQYSWMADRMAGLPMNADRNCVDSAPTCCSGSPAATCTP